MAKQTTKKQFKSFKNHFKYYQDKFGLTRYRIHFEHVYIEEDVYATIEVEEEHCVATVKFSKKLYHSLDIKSTALHEATHLLLATLVYLGRSRCVASIEIRIAEEHIVNILEKVIP